MNAGAEYCCRVCGLRHDDPPWGVDGRTPLFELCDCCGVEFGYQDSTPVGAKRFRDAWLTAGAAWYKPAGRPPGWQLEAQLRDLPEAFR